MSQTTRINSSSFDPARRRASASEPPAAVHIALAVVGRSNCSPVSRKRRYAAHTAMASGLGPSPGQARDNGLRATADIASHALQSSGPSPHCSNSFTHVSLFLSSDCSAGLTPPPEATAIACWSLCLKAHRSGKIDNASRSWPTRAVSPASTLDVKTEHAISVICFVSWVE